jgi:hypothetical protein
VVSRFDVCHTTENRLSSIGMYAMFSRPVNTMSSLPRPRFTSLFPLPYVLRIPNSATSVAETFGGATSTLRSFPPWVL